jgi:hypothetical protein
MFKSSKSRMLAGAALLMLSSMPALAGVQIGNDVGNTTTDQNGTTVVSVNPGASTITTINPTGANGAVVINGFDSSSKVYSTITADQGGASLSAPYVGGGTSYAITAITGAFLGAGNNQIWVNASGVNLRDITNPATALQIHNLADGTSISDAVNVGQLHNAVAPLQSQVGALGAQVSGFGSQITTLNNNYTTLNSQVQTNTTDIASLNTQVTSNTNNINTLNTNYTALNSQVQTNTTNITNLSNNYNALSSQVQTNTINTAKNTAAIAGLQTSFNQLDKNLSGGVAAIGSMAAVPQVPESKSFALGAGTSIYNNEVGVALGGSANLGNGWMAKASVAMSPSAPDDRVAGSIGVGYSW